MPTEAVQNRTFKDLFNGTVRFEIPFFQRGYAWEKRQWNQLFLDLQEQVIDELGSENTIDDVEHFFGPIVVLEKVGGEAALKEFLVIDGQQRIVTVYLLLGIIRESLNAKKHLSVDASAHLVELEAYLANKVDSRDDYIKLKVFSSKGDRLPTYRAIFGADSNPTTPRLQTDLQLYVPGKNRVDEFTKYATKKLRAQFPDVPALWQLAQVLLRSLKIVWIPLDSEKDDPQAIFESLNDKGMPLTASELLCNYLFRPIMDAKEDFEDLHNQKWLGAIRLLESDTRFEEYLRNLFSIGENKMVGKRRRVYIHFKNKNRSLSATSAKQQLDDIYSGAPLYRTITAPLEHRHKDEGINRLLVSIANTRMESSTSFVLAVLRALSTHAVNEQQCRAILRETLTLLVRRKMAELPTTQYDAMFPGLLGKIVNEEQQVRALHEQFRKVGMWVSDQEFRGALIEKPLYRSRDLAFARMVLIEIDRRLQSHGQLPDYTTVNTIEHTLPQALDDDWRAYLEEDADDEHLEVLTNSLGNLCLLSGPANSSAGRNPFDKKRAGYSEVTALARHIKRHTGKWNLNAIRQRSQALSEQALEIWAWSIV
ncbi:MAG: DUF262 domain-containing protein [Rhodospirillaceae bacterium]|nr:DUF262 domain-containing protein [Rhodospirillaceae bacterium]